MAFNGHQRDDESIDEDETPTKQPRSNKEMPSYPGDQPNNEASASAGRTASDRTAGSTRRHRVDSVKKTRPRRCQHDKRGLSVFTGKGTITCLQKSAAYNRQLLAMQIWTEKS